MSDTPRSPRPAFAGPTPVDKFRIGDYWLDHVAGSPFWYVCWNDPAIGDRRRLSLRTPDFAEAQRRLVRFIEGGGRDFERRGGDPLVRDVVLAYLDLPRKRESWASSWRTLLATLDAVAPSVTMSGFVGEVQKEMIRALHRRPMGPKSIANIMILLAAATRWAHAPNDRGQILSAHRYPVLCSVPDICAFLDVAEPGPRNWHPTRDEMAAALVALARDEPFRRLCVLMLLLACRTMAAATATRAQLDLRHGLYHVNPDGRRQTTKRRPVLPLPPRALAELAAWPEAEWVALSAPTIQGHFVTVRRRIGLPRLVSSAFRDYMATAMRHAHIDFGVPRVPAEEVEMWMGHRVSITPPAERLARRGLGGTIHERYGVFSPEYLATARLAVGTILDDLDRRTGGLLLPHAPALLPAPRPAAPLTLRQVPANQVFSPREMNCANHHPMDGFQGGESGEATQFQGENGGNRGHAGLVPASFRQARKPAFCTLDELWNILRAEAVADPV
ncbi:hypothetical protein [Microvirga splendida]|uniref:Phage integrase family protein n=1 Tax=Microvirga splendida TaxID=2795727 RepID=A0ABS0Y352_9HYPH|nr:hypothetical protein [Microvirga splendida]MBJ6126730.1 hypothetical protein [Microvirga splendida]